MKIDQEATKAARKRHELGEKILRSYFGADPYTPPVVRQTGRSRKHR